METDHKNVTFLKTAQSAKVRRWQLTLQEFDFRYVHIAGADNVVADALTEDRQDAICKGAGCNARWLFSVRERIAGGRDRERESSPA